ncbi:tetratricopeptide repeat-containing sensor histidine kinase [Balneola vulgaris]|uniref:tetratricopeptide repeat-containing sensor histidine kinase n=1 Tax=Balneola vulgaris TaxID=287535 RepID=UPI000A071363|nr:tetratricopeptide repeat-containing sensor histidine kinase [Balneola vulgaris]
MRKVLRIAFVVLLYVFISTGIMAQSVKHNASLDTSYVVNLLDELSNEINKGNIELAKQKAREAKSISIEIDFDDGIVRSELTLVDAYLTEKLLDSAETLIQHLILTHPESKYRARMHNFEAVAYNYRENNIEAINAFNQAEKYLDRVPAESRDRMGAGITMNRASSYMKIGDRISGFESYLSSLRFAEQSGDTLILIIGLNNLGDSYTNFKEFDKAVFYLERALTLVEEKELDSERLRILMNLANAKTGQEEYSEAESLYKEALELHKKVRQNIPPYQILFNMGKLYVDMGEYDQAYEYLSESLEYCVTLNIPQGIYFNQFGLGQLYFFQKDYPKAIDWLKKAYVQAEMIGSLPMIQDAREYLYESYKLNGAYNEALVVYEEFVHVNDSLKEVESNSKIAEFRSELELDRQTELNRLLEEKQHEQEARLEIQFILILAASIVIALIFILLIQSYRATRKMEELNAQLQNQKEELEQVSKTKDKLFAIISHDLRSPLSSMQGLLYLINSDHLTLSEIKDLVKNIEPTMRKNVDTMENLLAWAREQLSGVKLSIDNINIQPVVEGVIDNHSLQIEAKNIEVHQQYTVTNALADSNALRLVVRNLITNAIKFTPKGGNIFIQSIEDSEDDNMVRFSIKDTGIGIPESMRDTLFKPFSETRRGTAQEKGSGFGLSICKEFVERMNGSLTFESKENEGSTFIIKLPKSS